MSLIVHLTYKHLLLGTYPHMGTPSSHNAAKPTATTALTQQEIQAAAVAAAEQGYHDREYYVDDGNDSYYYDYDGEDVSAYVGPEGCFNIIVCL